MQEVKPEIELVDKEQAAFKLSSLDVIRRARETGTPVIVWENNQIMRLTPDEAERQLLLRQQSHSGETG